MKIIEEIRNEENKKQRERIRAFDKEMISYQANGLPPAAGQYVWGFLAVFWTLFPLQAFEEGSHHILFLGFIWVTIAPLYYLMPYNTIRENGKQISSYQKMKYLPVDIRQIKLVRIGYIVHFLKRTLTVSMILQLLSTLVCYRTISIWNILYVLVFCGVVPFLTSGLSVWMIRSK